MMPHYLPHEIDVAKHFVQCGPMYFIESMHFV